MKQALSPEAVRTALRTDKRERVSDINAFFRELFQDDSSLEVNDFSLSGELPLNDFSGAVFHRTVFQNVRFGKGHWEGTSFNDCLFIDSDFSNCNFAKGWFDESIFMTSKGVGASFENARLSKTIFLSCNMQYANFNACKADQCIFENSDFSEGTFSHAVFKNISFVRSRFIRTAFLQTLLKGTDLSTSEIDGLILSENLRELKGSVMNLLQASELAKRFGVIISE